MTLHGNTGAGVTSLTCRELPKATSISLPSARPVIQLAGSPLAVGPVAKVCTAPAMACVPMW